MDLIKIILDCDLGSRALQHLEVGRRRIRVGEKLAEYGVLRAKWGSQREREWSRNTICLPWFTCHLKHKCLQPVPGFRHPCPCQPPHLDLFPFPLSLISIKPGAIIYRNISPLPTGFSRCFSLCPGVSLGLTQDKLCGDKDG